MGIEVASEQSGNRKTPKTAVNEPLLVSPAHIWIFARFTSLRQLNSAKALLYLSS